MPDATTGAGLEAHNVAGAMTTMRLDELISKLAIGIARGQLALDQACMDIARFMSEDHVAFGKRPGTDQRDLMSLIELGFTPNFYQFVDTVLELRVAVSTKSEEKWEQDTSSTKLHSEETEKQSSWASQQSSSSSNWWSSWGWGGSSGGGSSSSQSSQAGGSTSFKTKDVEIQTVDATYANTYQYAVEASSVIKTKIVPVPPPAVFEEIVRAKVLERRDWERRMRLTEEARTVFLGQMGAADSMLEKVGKISLTVPAKSDGDVRVAATKLQESHNALSNEHWALTRSVADRAAADGWMNTITARSAEIAKLSAEPDVVPEDLKSAVHNALTEYRKLADSLQKRLTATGTPTPP